MRRASNCVSPRAHGNFSRCGLTTTRQRCFARPTLSSAVRKCRSCCHCGKDNRSQTAVAVVRAMKRRAQQFLPPLLAELASMHGLTYKKVRVTGARSKWGSCTSAGTINLSCYLMLLPPHLMDYVLLHELAHTREMNHGQQFYALLNSMTDGMALQLRSQLRAFRTSF